MEDDEEFEKLLGEIPRATSAPPHLEELQRALGVQLDYSSFLNVKEEDMKHQDFSRRFPETRKSNQSMDNRLYNDPLLLSPKSSSNQLSSFYSGLALDSPRTMYQLRELELQQKQGTQIHSQNSSEGQLQHASSSGLLDHSSEQVPLDNQSLSTAFANLNFDDSSDGEALNQTHVEKAMNNGVLEHVAGTALISESDSGLTSHLKSEASSEPRLPRSLPTLGLFSHSTSSAKESVDNGYDELPMATAGHSTDDRPMQRSPGMNFFSNGQNEAGYFSNHYLQEQQNNIAAYTVAAGGMQSGCQYPNASGIDMFPPTMGQQVHYPLDMGMASFVQAQRMQDAALWAQQQMEERVQYRHQMQQEFLLRQQQLQEQKARFYASLQGQPGASGSMYSRPHLGTQLDHQPSFNSSSFNFLQEQVLQKPTGAIFDGGWKQQQSQGVWDAPMIVPVEPAHTPHFAQGFGRGETYPFSHFQLHNKMSNPILVNGGVNVPSQEPPLLDKIAARKSMRTGQAMPGVSIGASRLRKKDTLANGHSNGHVFPNGNHLSTLNQLCVANGDSKVSSKAAAQKSLDSGTLRCLNAQHHLSQQQQQPKYTTLEEVEGRIFTIAKDQHGCRFLQRKFEQGVSEDVHKIFIEIIDHIVELMTDPFGNYLVQKLLEVCDEAERMEVIRRVTGKGQLVTISLNMHGTRAVQKLIETLKSPEQVAMVMSSLRQGVVTLIKDLNGNHVVQRSLQRLSIEDSQFIFDAAVSHCVEIATHRHGCCVLQRCVDYASGHQRQRLVAEIAANALILSQDAFGNYVVQYILDLGIPWATVEVISHLEGNYAHLAMQKFSSNVVEKCLKLAGEESQTLIIQELITSLRLGQLLQDPFANYVVQSALTVSKGSLHTDLVEAIHPHFSVLRTSPYGKRILSRINLKK